ncbi:hypothetical protein ACJIZ3_021413 [Penstemon smallii]|uniref:Uncharacterized protein n=1 Tax=Penstemon smallii TaxID=265156 RepID=A0ABD3SLB5_9LAMI
MTSAMFLSTSLLSFNRQ